MDYRQIINSEYAEPAAIISYKDGRIAIREINDRFLPEFGMNIAKEEFVGADLHKSFDDANLEIFVKAIARCAETGEEQIIETWRVMFSNCCGTDKVCLASRFLLLEKNNEEALVYESIRNITNERRSQETLSDVEYRYKQASEQINIYNWEYTIATKEMRPCYRCMRDLGLPALVTNYPEPAIDMGIFPADYADMYRDMMRKIDEGATGLEADIPLTIGRIPFRIKYTTEYDENGKPVKAFGSATLISETELGHIKLDNQIIQSLAERYHCIYLADFVKDSVKIIKQDAILSLEEGADCRKLAGLIASNIRYQDDERLRQFGNVQSLRTELFKDCDQREFVYRDDEGERWIRTDVNVIERGELGVDRMLVMISVVDDLRAQKMDADRLIAEQNKELEDRQNMLINAIDEANRANSAKTEFFSNMSHDIRTPMSAITGFSRLAMEEMDNREHLTDYLDKIVSSSDHLLNLINDILDMSRIESGKMELSLSPVKIKDLLAECADMIRVKMEENGLAFDVDIDGVGDDLTMCDKLRFNQVILNLLSNASKFTPRGGNVSLKGVLKEKGDKILYEIRVKDNGIGMSEEFSKHIWEAYSRENTEVVSETQGTGLGMAIVRKIVNLMQGAIELKTELGKGSEFIIELSLNKAAPEALAAAENTDTEEALTRDFSGKTILLVDDSPVNIKLADRMLGMSGFTVITADNGVNAIEILKKSQPGDIDLILMDVMMPIMDGLEATRRIRKLKDRAYSDIPIIAMTANAFASDIEAALDAGMNAHIPKPFKKEELIRKISANLP